MTVITPACTGSVTTRSAASGTLPAMLRLITRSPCCADLADGLLNLSAHQRPREHQRSGSRQAGHGADSFGDRLLAHQRNGIDGDVLASDVMAVGFRDGAGGHLPDLRAAADDDDALAVDLLHRFHKRDFVYDRELTQRHDQELRIFVHVDLEVDAGFGVALFHDLHRGDVRLPFGENARQLMQYSGAGFCSDHDPDSFGHC